MVGYEFEFDILAEASDQDEEVLIEALEDAERATSCHSARSVLQCAWEQAVLPQARR